MSETRYITVVTNLKVQATSRNAALKLAKKYVNINTGPGDTVTQIEGETTFYDMTDSHTENYEEIEDETEDDVLRETDNFIQ